ncbi:aldehyde dehydrogenase family protein [Frankia sp. AiPs1]|uniref:aldehyde dehydrogenase family protein n=1 Tax=Frankia sp. AiPs1 TaxID=573493 RepID=UPI0020448C1F|nr:aldehyde dehydrogenase family protein [Frankia sp. AiPs1]MCM3921796.1 aldehyde dehydrogenase family protein [Frankia sp. AiPs1]
MLANSQLLLVDGELVTASDGAVYSNINPATEEVIGAAPAATRDDAVAAIAAARHAFDLSSWSQDADLRRESLQAFADGLRKISEDLRTVIVAESGSPVALTRSIQLDGPLDYLQYYIDLIAADEVEHPLPAKEIFGVPSRRIIRREPIGVVAAITPWNYPFYLNIAKIGAALAAGCTVVLKPAPETPWSATLIGAVAAETLPPGVLNVITTPDNSVAEILTTHPDVDAVTFTGSTATGRLVMANAAGTVKRVLLELGGKSAAVLLDDADFAAAIPGVVGGTCGHAGQGCALLTRLLVPRHRLAEAVGLAEATIAAIPYGDPTDPVNIMGPLVSARQRDRVLGYFDLAREEGRVVAGGGRAEQFDRGYYVQPTLVADVAPDARIAQEEIFGPAVVVIGFDDDADAIRIANGTIYGLSGAVFGSPDRALGVARTLRTGTVAVNGAGWFDVESPFGGYRQSGNGREWGADSLREFQETKTISHP